MTGASELLGSGMEDSPITELCRSVESLSTELIALVDGDLTAKSSAASSKSDGGNVLIDRIVARQQQAGTASASTHHLAKKLKHIMLRAAVSPESLERIFAEIKANWSPADLTYNRYSRWNISSYCEVDQSWTPQTPPHPPLMSVMEQTLVEVKRQFEAWYCDKFGLAGVNVITLNSFVTRYSAVPDQDQLDKHVDGRRVDGSAIFALPTDAPYDGGQLTVWDTKAKTKYMYQLTPGDVLFLDTMVWHQAHPIANGNKWSLVCFYKCEWGKILLDEAGKKVPPGPEALAVRARGEQNAAAACDRASRFYDAGVRSTVVVGGNKPRALYKRPSRAYSAATRASLAELGAQTNLASHHLDDILEIFASLHIFHGEVVLSRPAFAHALRSLAEIDDTVSSGHASLVAANEEKLFTALDVDGSGTLDFDELANGIALLCDGVVSEKAGSLFSVIDPESLGIVSVKVAARCLETQLRVVHACSDDAGTTAATAKALAQTVLTETLREWVGPLAVSPSTAVGTMVSGAQFAHCIKTVQSYVTGNDDGQRFIAAARASAAAAATKACAIVFPIVALRDQLGLHEHALHRVIEECAHACDEVGLVSHAAFAHVIAPFVLDHGSDATARSVEDLWLRLGGTEGADEGADEGVDFQTLVSGMLPLLGGSTGDKAARMFEMHDVNDNYTLERDELSHFLRSVLILPFQLDPALKSTSIDAFVAAMMGRAIGDGEDSLTRDGFMMWFHAHADVLNVL